MNTHDFFPSDYSPPKSTSTKYLKLQEGENRFRILSQPIFGWEDWVDNRPMRYRIDQKPPRPSNPKMLIRFFMSMIVWSVTTEQIQIFHVTQATIRTAIENLCKDPEWGSPFTYDLKVLRKGEGKDTDYLVSPVPHKPIHEYIIEQFYETPIYLDALYDSGDPFADHGKVTPCAFVRPSSSRR